MAVNKIQLSNTTWTEIEGVTSSLALQNLSDDTEVLLVFTENLVNSNSVGDYISAILTSDESLWILKSSEFWRFDTDVIGDNTCYARLKTGTTGYIQTSTI